MALQLWEPLKEAIAAYTGLSPAAFFTLIALAVAVYHVISGFFVSPDDHRSRSRSLEDLPHVDQPPPSVQLGEITEEELKQYDGSDPKKPLLMAIKGQIYDVSLSRMFYGPGGPYALFAGKDASRALAKMSFEENDLTGDVSGLGPFELEALQDWEYKFMNKYVKVGTIKKNIPVTEGEGREGSQHSGTKEEESSSKARAADGSSRNTGEGAVENPDGPSRSMGEEATGNADESSRNATEENAKSPEGKTVVNGDANKE